MLDISALVWLPHIQNESDKGAILQILNIFQIFNVNNFMEIT